MFSLYNNSMRSLLSILLLLSINSVYSQNIIFNGSLEELDVPCVNALTGYGGTSLIPVATNIHSFKGSPDILNECSGVGHSVSPNYQVDIPKNYFGYQWARTGRGVCSYINSIYPTVSNNSIGEEIITFILNDSLIANKKYFFRFYTVLSDSVGYATDIVEAALSSQSSMNNPDQISYYSIVSHIGKGYLIDTLNWMPIFDTITATGNETFVNIGRLHKLSSNNITTVNTNAKPWTYPNYNYITYYIDDVALWPCDTIAPIANAGNDILICNGDSAYIGGHNYSDYYYSWWHDSICTQNGPTGIQRDEHQGKIWVKPTKNTWYYVQATDFKYDKTIDSVYVMVKNCTPTIPDTTICLGDEIIIGNADPYFSSWLWTPPDYLDNPWLATPIARPVDDITYYVTTTDTLGRTHIDSVSISVELCNLPPEIIIPNVITPNGDGINDIFNYQNDEFWDVKTQIFNRWGQLVFSGEGSERWDGTFQGNQVSDGVYFYQISAQIIGFDEVLEYRGSVSVFKT